MTCAGCGEKLDGQEAGTLVGVPDRDGQAPVLRVCIGCWALALSSVQRRALLEDGRHDRHAAARALAEAFCAMYDEAQAQVFIEVAAIAGEWPPGNMDQWYAVGRHLRTCRCSTFGARDLIRSLAHGVGETEPETCELDQ